MHTRTVVIILTASLLAGCAAPKKKKPLLDPFGEIPWALPSRATTLVGKIPDREGLEDEKEPSRMMGPAGMTFWLAVRAYQITASEHKHYGCQFKPSCSGYSVESLKKFGGFWGLLMTADRLIRCNWGARHFYAQIRTPDGPKLHDPPAANYLPDPDRSERPEFPPKINAGETRLAEILKAIVPKTGPWETELGAAAGEQAKLFRYGLALYADRDLYRAITEFSRFITYYPAHPLADDAQFLVGECYFLGARYGSAAKAYDRVMEKQHDAAYNFLPLKAALADFLGKRYEPCRSRCRKIIEKELEAVRPAPSRPDLAEYLIYCSHVEEAKYEDAYATLTELKDRKTWISSTMEIMPNELLRGTDLPEKNKIAGGILSAIIPGAGQVYAHRWENAVGSFILTGLFTWGSYESFKRDNNTAGYIFASVALTFYMGNIYNGAVSVTEYNEDLHEEFKVQVKEKSFFDKMFFSVGRRGELTAGIRVKF